MLQQKIPNIDLSCSHRMSTPHEENVVNGNTFLQHISLKAKMKGYGAIFALLCLLGLADYECWIVFCPEGE
jgi:hypothetical protein